MQRGTRWVLGLLVLGTVACQSSEPRTMNETVERARFGTTQDGVDVEVFTLTNHAGCVAKLITYGATLTELHVPDRDGHLGDVVLGFDNLRQYETESPYFGCTTGRVANRIAGGQFSLDGVDYQLAVNNGPHHLHGGTRGLDKVVWDAKQAESDEGPAVRFTYKSPDGEENYPGNLSLEVVYTLTHKNELIIDYQASTDRATPVNLTHHSYFNLAGPGNGDVLDHLLHIYAHRYTESNETLVPTGRIMAVKDTPLDFTQLTQIGARIDQVAGGYDLNYVVDDVTGTTLDPAAEVYEPTSGRWMSIHTTEPGLQFYTGNFLDGTLTGKGGVKYERHFGFCLETQHFPDSVNQPSFPSIILQPGETYTHTIVHRFAVQD